MRKIALSISFILLYSSLFAQTDLVVEANYYYNQKDYFNAAFYYDLALDQDSNNFSLWYPIAQSYRQVHEYKKSAHYYQKIWNYDQGLNFPMSLFWFGVMNKNLERYDLAIESLREFLNTHSNTNDFWYEKALAELKGAELAKLLTLQEVTITHLDKNINSKESDFAPFILDSALFFTSLVKSDGLNSENYFGHHSKVYHSIDNKGAQPFRVINSDDFHVGNISFNPSGDQLFFSRCKTTDGRMLCQIYTSTLNDLVWSTPILLPSEFNPKNSTNTHPQWAFWNQMEGLFVSSDRQGGFGQLDIWFVSMDNKAFNLGNQINTKGNEVTPFYHSVEQVLYFSSNFLPNIGGYDIFQNKWDGRWSKTKNVGLPINSSHNDLYYISKIDNPSKGYFSSNRSGSLFIHNQSCCNDIYQFQKSEYCICEKQDSLVQELQLNLPLQLFFHNDEPRSNSSDSTTTVSYTQAFNSFYNKKNLYVRKFSSVLSGKIKSKSEREMNSFFESTVKKGMNQLQEFASQLVFAMDLKAKVELNLIGFSSPLNTIQYNQKLSKRRIASVLNYLNTYNDGVLMPYFENGNLKINELPIGESRVNKDVSDNPNDRRKSVYSINAAFERRIEIQSISIEF